MSRGSSGAKKTAGGGLGTKIMVSMGTVLALVTLLTGICLYMVLNQPLSVARPERSPAPTDGKSDQAAAQAGSLLLEARTIELQFRQQQTPVSVVQFEEVSKNLLARTLELENNAKQRNDQKAAQTAAQISQLASRYSTSFRELVQAWEIKGIKEDAGLRQKLRQAGRNITSPAGPAETARPLEEALLHLGRAEQNYFAARDGENQRLLIAAANTMTEAAGESSLDPSQRQAITSSINKYITAFDRFQAVSLATADPALTAAFAAEQVKQEDAMHKAALELEKLISSLNTSSQGETTIQTLRQQEQEYLKQGDAASAALVKTTLAEYDKSLNAAPLPQTRKTALQEAASEYQSAFAALVDQDQKIKEQGTLVDQAFAELQARIKEITPGSAPPAPAKMPVSGLTRQLSLMIIASTWLVTVLTGLLLARMLTGLVTSPVRRMTDIARRMVARGDAGLTFPPEKNEFGPLASAFNDLLRQQAANVSDGETAATERKDRTAELARLFRDRVDHDDRIAGVVAGQGDVLARIRTVVGQLNDDAGTLHHTTGKLADHGQAVQLAAADCEQAVTASVDTVQAIAQPAGQMGALIKAFVELAEQTSVMALNAAIKAARAGIQGKEFSTMTEELDRLAKRSMETAREITQLLDDIGTRVAAGEKPGNESRLALQRLVASSSASLQIFGEIAKAVSTLQAGVGDTTALLAELGEIGARTDSLIGEAGPLNKAVEDGLARLGTACGMLDDAEHSLESMEDIVKNMMQADPADETGPDLPASADSPGVGS